MIIPPYLEPGDTIGIICPAGYMPFAKMETCIQVLQEWGYRVKLGKTAGSQFHYFSGTDEERLADVQTMLDDVEVQAIFCGRGGYGVSRIIDRLDFTQFSKKPKWIVGYSDITVLHTHLLAACKIASLHAPMASAFADEGYKSVYMQDLRKALSGVHLSYQVPVHSFNRKGTAEAELAGGNLSLLAHAIGSVSELDTRNKILFVEDVGEYIYHIDRLFIQLKRAGKLDHLAGLVIGSFTDLKDTVIPFGQTVYELIGDKIKEYEYPVCFGFPVGHVPENYPLKVGVKHSLIVSENGTSLQELQ